MPRDTAGPISKRPGGPTVMGETSPRNTLTLLTDEVGTSCRLRTEREKFRTDRKTPTCATALRVWTLGRIETLRPRARSHLTRGRSFSCRQRRAATGLIEDHASLSSVEKGLRTPQADVLPAPPEPVDAIPSPSPRARSHGGSPVEDAEKSA